MEMIKTVRQQLGISQEFIAILIGVKRGQLEKAEKGTRPLPSTALLKLLQLHSALTSSPIPPAKPAKSLRLPTKLPKLIEDLQLRGATQSAYYLRLAEQIRTKHLQAQNCLAILPLLAVHYPPEEETSQALVLRILKAESERLIKNYSLELAAKCEKMAVLLAQLAKGLNEEMQV